MVVHWVVGPRRHPKQEALKHGVAQGVEGLLSHASYWLDYPDRLAFVIFCIHSGFRAANPSSSVSNSCESSLLCPNNCLELRLFISGGASVEWAGSPVCLPTCTGRPAHTPGSLAHLQAGGLVGGWGGRVGNRLTTRSEYIWTYRRVSVLNYGWYCEIRKRRNRCR